MREALLYADIEVYEGRDTEMEPTPELRIRQIRSIFLNTRGSCRSRSTRRLTKQLLNRLIVEGLLSEAVTKDHVSDLYHLWQMPMYHLDFKLINVPLAELLEPRDAMMAAEAEYY
jgi:hypothetical protein